MSDALKLTDQDHDLAVLVTNSDEDPTPTVTIMDARTGQQVSLKIEAFYLMARAVDAALEDIDAALGETEAEEPATPKLN